MHQGHGTIAWNELNTFEPAKARAFYEAVLGWAFEEAPMPGGVYLIARVDDEMVAGIFDMKLAGLPANAPSHWLTYIAVDDVDVRAKAVEAHGGQVMRPPFDVPGVGRIAIVRDAAGAGVGLMTPE